MRQPLLPILAALALASGTAAAEGSLAGHTVSCSVAGPQLVGGCFYEVPVATLGPAAFSVGLDAQLAAPSSGRESYLAPFVILTVSMEWWSAWAELAAPDTWGVPVIGRPQAWRVGFSYTVPP